MQEIIEKCLNIYPCEVDVRYDEPMREHTTFKVGGPADCYIRPSGDNFPLFCKELISNAYTAEIPIFILGGGANIVVSDNGIRGIVLDVTDWKGVITDGDNSKNQLIFKSGTTMDEACEYALEKSLTGLEFLAGMPGTIGGAVYMNARCYGKEIADILSYADLLSYLEIYDINSAKACKTCAACKYPPDYLQVVRPVVKKDFGYKISPFQKMDCLIMRAAFNLQPGNKEQIKAEMEKNRQDRKDKGHYLFPCAGSAFKNNHDFGKPSGQIIDELGLKGFSIGGAQIAPFHGNIVINKDGATASDIKALMDEVAAKVKASAGFELEPEIIFV